MYEAFKIPKGIRIESLKKIENVSSMPKAISEKDFPKVFPNKFSKELPN